MFMRKKQNIESLQNLDENLRDIGSDLSDTPLVLQYNKRDLNGEGNRLMTLEEMERDLNPDTRWPSFKASALYGDGVKDTFKKICMMTVSHVCRQIL